MEYKGLCKKDTEEVIRDRIQAGGKVTKPSHLMTVHVTYELRIVIVNIILIKVIVKLIDAWLVGSELITLRVTMNILYAFTCLWVTYHSK